mgnify:CR=1 FL=1
MTYLVTEDCIKCKHTTCVEVCPVITENGDPDPEHEKYHPVNFPDGKMYLYTLPHTSNEIWTLT